MRNVSRGGGLDIVLDKRREARILYSSYGARRHIGVYKKRKMMGYM